MIDLTDIEGRYILPLQTKDLKSLQQQMQEDYGLVLNHEKRTVAMKVVNWQ